MSKYKSKQQLLDEITKTKENLDTLLIDINATVAVIPGACGDWSIKDIVCHLVEWQNMVLSWYEVGTSGGNPTVPSADYKWSQLPELNNAIYLKYKDINWQTAQNLFAESEKRVMTLINETPESVLLMPGLQSWMNKNTLIAYLGSCTSSHYIWASGLIKKFCKEC